MSAFGITFNGQKTKVENLFKGLAESEQFTVAAAHKAFGESREDHKALQAIANGTARKYGFRK